MKKLSAFTLKIIAVTAMTIDHIALVFVPPGRLLYWLMRLVGRLTAPIMAFFIAEGLRHTRSRKKYLLRLGAFALISQPIYFYMIFGRMPINAFEFLTNWNVMFSLAVALLSRIILESDLPETPRLILTAVCVSLGSFGDWSLMIPVWTLIFYIFRDDFRKMASLFVLVSVVLETALFYKNYSSFAEFSCMYGTLLALIPLQMYSGERGDGRHKKLSRWGFYVFYPAHIAVLVIIRMILTYQTN